MSEYGGALRCRECGSEIDEADTFCRSCGVTVHAGPPAPPHIPQPAQSPWPGSAPAPFPRPAKTNTSAVVALVTGILSLVMCPLVGFVGIVAGLRGRRQVRESAGAETGDGLAVAGIATGTVGVLVGGLAVTAIVAVTFLGRPASSRFSSVGTAISDPYTPPSSYRPPIYADPSTTVALPTAAPGPFTYGTGSCPPATDGGTPTTAFAAAPRSCLEAGKAYTATFDTTAGTVKVALDATKTPGTTNNFVALARYGYYDGTQLFRADPSIDILQGGARTNSASDPGPGYTIPDEGGPYTYQPGQLVMARSTLPNSAGSQFFFTAGPKATTLNSQGNYVVFGDVTEGLDVLKKMLASADTSSGDPLGGHPNPAVTVTKVTISAS